MKPHADQDSSTPLQPVVADVARPSAYHARGGGALRAGFDSARLEAASSLIGDESPAVRRALAREFQRAGRAAGATLRKATRSSDARVRSHARALIDDLRWERARRRLSRYIASAPLELEAGLWCISALERSNFDARPYRKALDAMAREVTRRADGLVDPLDRCKLLVDYLGLELGYAGDLHAYTGPDNIYLHRTIERKKGLPLTLCALYACVAKRCGLRTGLVPLPGHVMLRLFGRHENLIVDPFHGGEARSQDSLMNYLAEHGLQFKPLWFESAKDRDLLRRQVANLRNSLVGLGRHDRARRLVPVLDQFDAR